MKPICGYVALNGNRRSVLYIQHPIESLEFPEFAGLLLEFGIVICSNSLSCCGAATEGSTTPTPSESDGGGYICPAGYYCPSGAVTPHPCSPGTYREDPGGKSASDCLQCPFGTYQRFVAMVRLRESAQPELGVLESPQGYYCNRSHYSEGSTSPLFSTNSLPVSSWFSIWCCENDVISN